jgi:hypothetical protein
MNLFKWQLQKQLKSSFNFSFEGIKMGFGRYSSPEIDRVLKHAKKREARC